MVPRKSFGTPQSLAAPSSASTMNSLRKATNTCLGLGVGVGVGVAHPNPNQATNTCLGLGVGVGVGVAHPDPNQATNTWQHEGDPNPGASGTRAARA